MYFRFFSCSGWGWGRSSTFLNHQMSQRLVKDKVKASRCPETGILLTHPWWCLVSKCLGFGDGTLHPAVTWVAPPGGMIVLSWTASPLSVLIFILPALPSSHWGCLPGGNGATISLIAPSTSSPSFGRPLSITAVNPGAALPHFPPSLKCSPDMVMPCRCSGVQPLLALGTQGPYPPNICTLPWSPFNAVEDSCLKCSFCFRSEVFCVGFLFSLK